MKKLIIIPKFFKVLYRINLLLLVVSVLLPYEWSDALNTITFINIIAYHLIKWGLRVLNLIAQPFLE